MTARIKGGKTEKCRRWASWPSPLNIYKSAKSHVSNGTFSGQAMHEYTSFPSISQLHVILNPRRRAFRMKRSNFFDGTHSEIYVYVCKQDILGRALPYFILKQSTVFAAVSVRLRNVIVI